ncbi:BTB/POZ domain-containing protein 6-B-like [Homalodisca vitripennis]|nr:BTB/POZ domain-containing protein 6-B-like [Homalodisca vitripennis]
MAEGGVPGDYIMERQDLHDVIFLVGSEKKEKISTVKLLLANYSPVFRAMLLETDMREKHSEENIEIPNHEPDVFKMMLSYVYGVQDLKFLDVDQAMRFHLLVDQYLMTKLKTLSSAYLMNECKNNIRDSLKCAVILDIKEMEPTATEILQSDIKHFLSTNDFKLLDRKIIEFILKLEHLDIEEIELWWALMSWVKYNYDEDTPGTTVREKLGNMLSYVRFLAMSQKEFAEEVVKTSILTDYEMIHMFVALASGKPHGLKYLSAEGKRHPTVFVLEFKGYTTAQSSFSTFTHTILVKNRRLRLISVNLTSVLSHFYVNLEKDNSKVSTFGPFSNCASFTLDIILEANQSYNLVFETRSSGYTMCASKCEPHYSCNYCTVLVNTSSCIKNLTFIVS